MKKALLIIDVQNDYFENGRCELHNPNDALNAIKKVLNYFRENDYPVYFVQHISAVGADFFEPDTEGVKIHKDIEPSGQEQVIVKHYPNSFYQTTLQQELEKAGITELVICGMMTHMCIDTTVRAANELGYQITLISDACATKELRWDNLLISADDVRAVYLASLDKEFANVRSSEEVSNAAYM